MKHYRGWRAKDGCTVEVVSGRKVYQLDPVNYLRNHSPTGFEWGYGGSGPAQLALALLYDATGFKAEISLAFYQDFKREIIAGFDRQTWSLTEAQIHDWIVKKCCAELAGKKTT